MKKKTPVWVNALLFIITFFTCMAAGTQWDYKDFTQIENWHHGLQYAILVIIFLSAHEFGHYFAAKYHKVDATLPFYIPFPFPDIPINFGTMGAVIKTRDAIPTKKALFDIGIAGPLAGFVVCIVYLAFGFAYLPGEEFLLSIHPQYFHTGIPDSGLFFGDTILFDLMKNIFAAKDAFIPPMNEVYHYSFLNVGWFGLFVTTLNMLPMGQLDGGHITYAMFGKVHRIIARVVWWLLLIFGIGGFIKVFGQILNDMPIAGNFSFFVRSNFMPILKFLDNNFSFWLEGWTGWLVWALVAKFFIKLDHPPVNDNTQLDLGRIILGWISIAILLLCFSYTGIYFV
jgi:membrane-associated protease RseP (regulator of RpoE activity)